jgi:hypothetical protein
MISAVLSLLEINTVFPVSICMGIGAAGGSAIFFALAIGMVSRAIAAAMQKIPILTIRNILSPIRTRFENIRANLASPASL